MASILDMLRRFESLDNDKIIRNTIEESKEAIKDKNLEQLYSGENKTGNEILPAYRPLTVAIKQSKGQPTDRVTLRDTGSFYRGVYVSVQGDKIVTDSTDYKSEKLKEKYSEDIFGLNDKFKIEAIRETIRPVFKYKIETATKLIMK